MKRRFCCAWHRIWPAESAWWMPPRGVLLSKLPVWLRVLSAKPLLMLRSPRDSHPCSHICVNPWGPAPAPLWRFHSKVTLLGTPGVWHLTQWIMKLFSWFMLYSPSSGIMPCASLWPPQCLAHNRLFINLDDGAAALYLTCIKWAVSTQREISTTSSLVAIAP